MYEVAVGMMLILTCSLVWVILSQTSIDTRDIMLDLNFRDGADITDITTQINLSHNLVYISLMFITVLIFVWIVKRSINIQEEKRFG